MSNNVPTAPRGLGAKGKRLWKSLHQEFDFSGEPGKVEIIEQACRTADRIEELSAGMQGEPLVIPGSHGGRIIHPLIQEERQQRNQLSQLIRSLGLPESADESDNGSLSQVRREAGRKGGRASGIARLRSV